MLTVRYKTLVEKKIRFTLPFLLFFLFYAILDLQAETWDATWQNDIVFGTDKNYTNGINAGWASDEIYTSSNAYTSYAISKALSEILFTKTDDSFPAKYYAKMGISQDMYTPSNLKEKERLAEEPPYAGHLYLRYTLSQVYKESTLAYFASIGVVGPSSGAEHAQKFIHKITDSEEPMGWDNQLEDELTYGIGVSYTCLIWGTKFGIGDQFDLFFTPEVNIGNFIRSATIGGVVRYGRNFPRILRVSNSLQGGVAFSSFEYENNRADFGWAVNYGCFINAVNYFYIMDKSDKHNLHRETYSGSDAISLNLFFSEYEVALSLKAIHFLRIEESFGWGSISISKRF